MLGQGRVVHGNHFGMLLQEFNHFQGILHMTFHAKRQRLQSLQQNESIERTDCGTGITQQYGTDTDGIGSRTGSVDETYSMITRVRFRQLGKLPRGHPVELAAIYNNTTQGRTMPSDELRCRMDYNICPMLYGTNQVRSTEGVIYNQRNPVTVCYFSNGINVNDVAIRISQRFNEYCLGILLNRFLEIVQIARVHKSSGNPVDRQCVGQQIIRSTVDGLSCHDMVACTGDILKGISDGCRTRGYGQSGNTAFQSRHTFLEHILGGIRQPPVNIPRVLQAKAGCRMGRITKYIRSCLIDRYGAGISCRVGLFLSNVKL